MMSWHPVVTDPAGECMEVSETMTGNLRKKESGKPFKECNQYILYGFVKHILVDHQTVHRTELFNRLPW